MSPDDALLITAVGWCVIAILYLVAAILLHAKPDPQSIVVRYQPPDGISAAAAAYFLDGARADRALAVSLVSMAEKGAIKITQEDGMYVVGSCNDKVDLEPEERTLRTGFVPTGITSDALAEIYSAYCSELQGAVEPVYLSRHTFLVVALIVLSALAALPTAGPPLIHFLGHSHRGSFRLFLVAIVVAGVSSYWALLTATSLWHKLRTWLPSHEGHRLPLHLIDLTCFGMLALALVAFGTLGLLMDFTSSLALAAFLFLHLIGTVAMRAPTDAGRKLHCELEGYRRFLDAVERGQLNVLNDPELTPDKVQKNLAYALAVGVEHSWGEQLSIAITDLLAEGEEEKALEAVMASRR